ncbi:MAG: citramalate synthase, partial [Myxococcales bacterium]|nr:citramalate synthase [Myxococcales bacterium]
MVTLYDTTLRDGAQTEGISFSLEDKLRIAEKIAELGVHYIEGGYPGSNPKDIEFFRHIRERELGASKIIAFGSTRRAGAKADRDEGLKALIDVATDGVCIVGKASILHVTESLRVSNEEALDMIRESVAWLKARTGEVLFDAEHFFDGYKTDPAFALEALRAAAEAGADLLVLCDTNGGSLPFEVETIVRDARARIATPLGIHCHNDTENAVANSLAAIHAGAVQVQGTINGYG